MADPANITSLLAALAQRSNAPQGGPPAGQPQPGLPAGYPGSYASPPPPNPLGGFALPQPTSSGNLDLSAIKPVNSGTVSISDAIAKARGIAAEKGVSSGRDDSRGRGYRRSPSRSPPPRRENYRDNYNPYRDERRGDRRDYQRDRSYSPGPRDRRGGNAYEPGRHAGRGDRSPPSRAGGGGGGGGGDDVEIIQIDSTLVGLIIGRSGENLRRVEQDTGCRVQFITGPDVSGPRRDCKLTGSKRARDDAKNEITRIIEENGRQPGNSNLGTMPPGRSYGSSNNSHTNPPPRGGDDDDTTQIMVPDRTVGLIIGRGGETIRDLQEKSGCHVNIVGEQKSVNGLRPVNLIGSARSAQIAKDLIMEIVQSDNKNLADQGGSGRDANRFNANSTPVGGGPGERSTGTVIVPSSAVGMIIGKGGETIKEMQNQSGCKINVSPQTNPNETERSIGLVGTPNAIAHARKLIEDKVEIVTGGSSIRSNRNDSYNDPYSQNQQQQHSYGQNPGQGMQQGGQPPAGADGADPYAIYGGYQNYVNLWTQAMAQQQAQAQQGGGQGETRPPGTS